MADYLEESRKLMPGRARSHWSLKESVAGAPGAFAVSDAEPPSLEDMKADLIDRVRRPRWEYPSWALPKVKLDEAYSSGPAKTFAKLPPKTDIRHETRLSSWGGKLAVVRDPSQKEDDFDPKTMTHAFLVMYAVDPTSKKPLSASDHKFVDEYFDADNPSAPMTKTLMTVQKVGATHKFYFRLKPAILYRVKTTLRDMGDEDHFTLGRYYVSKGYEDVSDLDLKKGDWVKVLKMTFADIQEKLHYSVANEVDMFLDKRGVDTTDDHAAEAAWAKVKGVYTTARNGRIKFVVVR